MSNLSKEDFDFLAFKAYQIRRDSIRATTAAKSGHPTSCLSASDIVSTLFFKEMSYDPQNPHNLNNDRLVLSKGHAIPVIYAAWKNVGLISDEDLLSLRKVDSPFEGHPTPRWGHNEAATGSLGQGLSVGLGFAFNALRKKIPARTYVIMGDGEIAEGSIWEAAEIASHYNIDNLVGIVDCNRLGQSGESLHEHDVEKLRKKWETFGWNAIAINGHDLNEINDALNKARNTKGKPTAIIARTIKGHPLTIQDKNGFHGKPISAEDMPKQLKILDDKHPEFANYKPKEWSPKKPSGGDETVKHPQMKIDLTKDPKSADFDKKIAPRKAFGYALVALGKVSDKIWALDADVKNSTYTEFFEKEFPDRFIEAFIAEQNLVGMSVGLQLRGDIPFSATFGAFYTRAFDQLRMAGIGRNAIRLAGSHCGVSIGADGPSQMALEDIAMIRTIPHSIVLYPSDGVSTYKLTELMANYHDGISYLRTTRADLETLYDKNEKFEIGGCKVLKQSDNDQAVLIAAGITLHEALAAYESLKSEGTNVAVIDLYSVKPLDAKTIRAVAKKAQNRIITIEDHYLAGGIGEAVAAEVINNGIRLETVCVTELSRSGEERELMELAGIDRKSIVKRTKQMFEKQKSEAS
jgi:transketolase